jgi:hypothetical protein
MADAIRMRPAAILGGGPSLPDDLKKLPWDCVLIGVNHHALKLCKPDYLVFMDDPNKFPDLQAGIDSFTGQIVCPFERSDVKLPKGQYWDGGFSSALATWFALWQGYEPVILCGMDCYQGEEKYFYKRDFYHPVFDAPLADHVRAWRVALKKCPNPERIKAMSGPLVEVFGQYEIE